tara:strand:+ start:60367 stop:60498 length:132 start_codon:yes stop_codon:yes gene_type:complete
MPGDCLNIITKFEIDGYRFSPSADGNKVGAIGFLVGLPEFDYK